MRARSQTAWPVRAHAPSHQDALHRLPPSSSHSGLGLRRDYSYHFSYHADRLRTGGKLSASISSIEPANGGVVSSGSDSLNVPSVLRSLRLLPARPPVPSSVVSVPAGGPVRPRP